MELTARQEEIIQAAITIIARQGFKALTTKNLAGELKLTEAALYRHFKNKNDLILRILDHFKNLSCEVLERIRDGELDPMEKIHRFVLSRYELFTDNPELAQVMFSEELFRFDPFYARQMQEIMEIHRDSVTGYISDAQARGMIAKELDPLQLFRIIIGSMRFMISQWNLGGHGFVLVKEGEALFQTIKETIEEKK
ncbi:MAG: TetR/AcrR family transcriptional regulator [Candidatus Syntrophosphaera sp.]